MKFAVTSQNFRTITGHAGRARRFLIYSLDDEGEPVEVERLDLPKEHCFHEWHGRDDEPHPVDGVDVMITASSGPGFIQRMARRGIRAATTSETDPVTAVRLFLQDRLPPGEEHDHDHEHHHHDHDHDHAH